jgi:DNA segregation ATPase FtsK/SpoIIIE, S-DNA-T family
MDSGFLGELSEEIIDLICREGKASASLIQRKTKAGYAQAARMLDLLQAIGFVSEADGSKPRKILLRPQEVKRRLAVLKGLPQKGRGQKETEAGLVKTPPPNVLGFGSHFGKMFQEADLTKKRGVILLGTFKGKPVIRSLSGIRNLLIIGNAQSGKEGIFDNLILSLLLQGEDKMETRMILIDNAGGLNLYNSVPHLLTPVINNAERVLSALEWTLAEMERRNRLLAEAKTRSFDKYNEKGKMSRIVVVIKNVEDVFCFAPGEIEDKIDRIVSYSGQVGIHLFLGVDRVSKNRISANIAANIPNRIVFQTTDRVDSKMAGVAGTEKLEAGKEFILRQNNKERRIEAIPIDEEEIKKVVAWFEKESGIK